MVTVPEEQINTTETLGSPEFSSEMSPGETTHIETPSETPSAPEQVEQAPEKYQEILSRVTPTRPASATDDDHADTVVLDAKHIGAMTDEEGKVQKLIDLAGTKGVVHAVKVARSLKDYYALDRMHDELSGKLYQGLLDRGLITKA